MGTMSIKSVADGVELIKNQFFYFIDTMRNGLGLMNCQFSKCMGFKGAVRIEILCIISFLYLKCKYVNALHFLSASAKVCIIPLRISQC